MKSFLTILSLILLLTEISCRKDPATLVPPVSQPLFSIVLQSSYLAAIQVDSAFAEWKSGNLLQRIRLTTRHDSLLTDMNTFHEGSGELTLHIFSNKRYNNQYSGEFVFHDSLTLEKTKSFSCMGPASFLDAIWSPRVRLSDAIGHEAVIALRPDDAYFIVGNPGHPVTKLTVERSYWNTRGGVQLTAQGIWECYTGCTDQPNQEFFSDLPSKIGSKIWNHISIMVLFEIPGNGVGWIISLEHEP